MIAFALAALLAQTAAPAAKAPPAARGGLDQCFEMSSFDRVRTTRPDAMFVRSGGRTFRIDTLPCPLAAHPSSQIVLKARGPGPICGAIDLEITVIASGLAQTCAVKGVTALTEAEAEALPSKDRP